VSLDNILFGSALVFTLGIPGFFLLWKLNPTAVRHMFGIAVIRDQDDEAIRRNVIAVCKGIDVSKLRIDEAEDLLEETARHAVAEHFAKANPGKAYKVTRDWPLAKCVISGNIAVVRIVLGHDFMGDHDGLRAVNFELNRESNVLNLRPWAPKQPEPAPDGQPERPRRVANSGANPSAGPARAEPKTESISKPKPARANMRKS